MAEPLLLTAPWARVALLAAAAGILALIWLRRSWVAALDEPAPAPVPASGMEAGDAAAGGTPAQEPASPAPRRSLVIAARNEEERLPGLLEDLERLLERDPDLEILLADDQSADGTRLRLAAFAVSREGRVRLLPADPAVRGKPAWLRRAVAEARGRHVLLTDADCRLGAGWSLALGALLDAGWTAAGGPVLLERGHRPGTAARWQRLHWLLLSGAGAALSARAAAGCGAAPSLWGANLAFDRAAVDALGGYAALALADLGEDLAFVRALARRGAPVRLATSPRELCVRTAAESWSEGGRQLARWCRALPRLGGTAALLVPAAALWLAALLLVAAAKPLLGLLLAAATLPPLHALLGELAARLGEEPVTLADAALYLAAWPLVALVALWHGLRGQLDWRRPA